MTTTTATTQATHEPEPDTYHGAAAGVAKLLGWMHRHHINVTYVQYCDEGDAELELPDLRSLVAAAGSLTAVIIKATDHRPAGRSAGGSGEPVLTVQITGVTDPGALQVVASAGLTGRVRDTLRTLMGAPMQPSKTSWRISVDVLQETARRLTEAGGS